MTLDEPYFLSNDRWCYFDVKKRKWMLTDEAPQKAIDSYKEYYKELREVYPDE